ncbi:response regulator [Leptospira sp. WS58.C1]|uniref:response regulator n=1 Tax=Leptospira cinconiae TaxID=3235173 RepID=UPI00349E5FF1
MISSEAKILIVEDESIVAKDILSKLSDLGYDFVSIASTGNEALRKVYLDKPDLLLMDIMLSRGNYDGIETVQEILDKMDLPVIYLTAYADESTLLRSKPTRPYGYLLKPFQTKELQIAIEIALNKYSLDKKRKRERRNMSAILHGVKDLIKPSSEEAGI